MESNHQTIVIVGAGHAAGELATSLRQNRFAGRVVVIGEEHHPPYQRPPLSKAYLSGDAALESLYLRPRATYERAGVELVTGVKVERLDAAGCAVQLSDGRTLHYDGLALTVGGRARALQTPDAERAAGMLNYHTIRTIADINRLQPQFERGRRVVIVGGGYVGLEVAAVGILRGLRVTVLEALPRVLARVTAPEISAFYERVHREAGVQIRTNTGVTGFQFDASGDAISAVCCANGEVIGADLVIVGVGLVPNVELAEQAGLVVDNGIVVDEYARTSDVNIVAAGDCTSHPSHALGRRVRLESVPNALEQARTAAATLCGHERPYDAVPWFWSDQYDLKLQMVGLSEGYDKLVLRGSPQTRSFGAFYLKGGAVIAADAISRPQDFMVAKRLVAERRIVAEQVLADESVPLKQLLTQSGVASS